MNIQELIDRSHNMAIEKGWWEGGRSIGELIVLVHSELSEALEEVRKGVHPGEIYHRVDGKPEGFGVELADAVIRIADICGRYEIDLEALIEKKMAFNATRPRKHGKEF